MNQHKRLSFSLWSAAFAVLAWCPVAHAEPHKGTTDEERELLLDRATDDSDDYSVLIRQAVAEFELGNYAEARVLFGQAHAAFPNARTLRALGLMDFELKNYRACMQELQAALVSAERPLSGSLRSRTEQVLRRARAFLGAYKLRFEPKPSELELRVDSAPAVVDEHGKLWLNAGEHKLWLDAPGYLREQRTLSVRGGEDETLTLRLRSDDPVVSPAAVSPASRRSGERVDSGSLWGKPWLWVSVAGVVAAGVVTAILLSNSQAPAEPLAGDVGGVVLTLGAR